MMRETLSGTILLSKISPNLVYMTTSKYCSLCLILYFAERKEEDVGKAEIAEKAETAETAEGPAPAPVPAPAPATTLEIVHE